MNYKSAELVGVNLEASKNGVTADANHIGKDNKVVYSQGGSLDAEAGASHTKETTVNEGTNEVLSTKNETTVGVGILDPVNLSASYTTEKDAVDKSSSKTGKLYLNVGWAQGFGLVFGLDVQVGLKATYKKKEK